MKNQNEIVVIDLKGLVASDVYAEGIASCEGFVAANPAYPRNELPFALATICIDSGVNTTRSIIGVLRRFGFSNKHVGAMLSAHSGSNPPRDRWMLNGDGTYTVHE